MISLIECALQHLAEGSSSAAGSFSLIWTLYGEQVIDWDVGGFVTSRSLLMRYWCVLSWKQGFEHVMEGVVGGR